MWPWLGPPLSRGATLVCPQCGGWGHLPPRVVVREGRPAQRGGAGLGAGGRARESQSRQGLGLCSCESIKLSLVVTESRGFSFTLSPPAVTLSSGFLTSVTIC